MSLSSTISTDMTSVEDILSIRFIGQVKWFNITSGYGFITACNNTEILPKNDKDECDIFVHFSSINKSSAKNKTPFIIQGEYVEFSVIKPETPKVNKEGKVYEYHANDITGLFRRTLFCDHFSYNSYMNYSQNTGNMQRNITSDSDKNVSGTRGANMKKSSNIGKSYQDGNNKSVQSSCENIDMKDNSQALSYKSAVSR